MGLMDEPQPVPPAETVKPIQPVQPSQPPEHTALPPATTAEENLKTFGQRRINLIWEVTQAIVAIVVAAGTIAIIGVLILRGAADSATALLLLSNAFFMIITAYFQRTNHTRSSGNDKEQR